jgi:hypothetical protein
MQRVGQPFIGDVFIGDVKQARHVYYLHAANAMNFLIMSVHKAITVLA